MGHDGIYLTLGSLNGTNPIFPFGTEPYTFHPPVFPKCALLMYHYICGILALHILSSIRRALASTPANGSGGNGFFGTGSDTVCVCG